jgi:hypothetical protein
VPLTHIQTVNWIHGLFGPTPLARIRRQEGLCIAFDADDVFSEDLHEQSMVVQVRTESTQPVPGGRITVVCWCEVRGRVQPGNFATLGDALSPFAPTAPAPGLLVNGVRFVSEEVLEGSTYRVLLKGDYVRGRGKLCVDANHLQPWVQDPSYRSGDGIEGGLFESWLAPR